MKASEAINAGMMLAVAGAMLAAVAASVRHGEHGTIERERCYGIARTGANDCANAVHSCAKQAASDSDKREWIAIPRGTCIRLSGGTMDERAL